MKENMVNKMQTFWENEKCSMWTDTFCFPTGHTVGAKHEHRTKTMKTTGNWIN